MTCTRLIQKIKKQNSEPCSDLQRERILFYIFISIGSTTTTTRYIIIIKYNMQYDNLLNGGQ